MRTKRKNVMSVYSFWTLSAFAACVSVTFFDRPFPLLHLYTGTLMAFAALPIAMQWASRLEADATSQCRRDFAASLGRHDVSAQCLGYLAAYMRWACSAFHRLSTLSRSRHQFGPNMVWHFMSTTRVAIYKASVLSFNHASVERGIWSYIRYLSTSTHAHSGRIRRVNLRMFTCAVPAQIFDWPAPRITSWKLSPASTRTKHDTFYQVQAGI